MVVEALAGQHGGRGRHAPTGGQSAGDAEAGARRRAPWGGTQGAATLVKRNDDLHPHNEAELQVNHVVREFLCELGEFQREGGKKLAAQVAEVEPAIAQLNDELDGAGPDPDSTTKAQWSPSQQEDKGR